MTQTMKSAMVFGVILAATGIGLLARGQSTVRPGDPTQARVWVENRGPNEAIPVVVDALPSPVTVRVEGVVHAAPAAQIWSYRTGQLPANGAGELLNNPYGSDGWEAVGVVQSGPNGATILFKRPR